MQYVLQGAITGTLSLFTKILYSKSSIQLPFPFSFQGVKEFMIREDKYIWESEILYIAIMMMLRETWATYKLHKSVGLVWDPYQQDWHSTVGEGGGREAPGWCGNKGGRWCALESRQNQWEEQRARELACAEALPATTPLTVLHTLTESPSVPYPALPSVQCQTIHSVIYMAANISIAYTD